MRGVSVPPHGCDRNVPTSGLQFIRTTSDEVLYLLGSDLCPLPGVGPFGLRGDGLGSLGGLGLLFGGAGVFAPEDSREERHRRRIHATTLIGLGGFRRARLQLRSGVKFGKF